MNRAPRRRLIAIVASALTMGLPVIAVSHGFAPTPGAGPASISAGDAHI